jgi:alkylation response protein AidB-like acyl-CoA dehydrogenase
MNFEYSDEQRLLSETLRKFLNTGYSFDARSKIVASPAGFSEDVWAALAEMGILGVPFDAEHGGFGGTTIDMMVVMEALGEALLVEPYLATVGLGGRFVARGGSAEQRARILPALIQGKLKMALAQTELGARWDLRRVSSRATKSGDGWVLEGDKRAVLHGGCADVLVVSARTAGAGDDARGISLFLVDRNTSGVTVTEYRGLDNLRVADVRLSGVRVGREALLGAEGEGGAVLEDVVDYATALVCAEAVGAIKYAHDATLEYLKTRRQFGVPIGSFQAIQQRLADVATAVDGAELLAFEAAARAEPALASMAFLFAAEAAQDAAAVSLHVHGGYGFMLEYDVQLYYRRAKALEFAYGSPDAQRAVIATRHQPFIPT